MHAFTILLFVGVPSNDQPADDDDDDADTWCCSLVLVGQAVEDHPGDHVAADVDGGEGSHACRSLTIVSNLREWVAIL